MNVKMEGPRRVAGIWVAALVDSQVTAEALGPAVAAVGHKAPVAVLIHDGTTLDAFAADGSRIRPRALEKLCPGAAERVSAAAGAGPVTPPRSSRPGAR